MARKRISRRHALVLAGTAGTSTIAGCFSGDDENEENETYTNGSQDQETEDGDTYSVVMEPAGEVTFDKVPETWVSYHVMYADMAVALGQSDGFKAVLNPFFVENANEIYYDELEGVSVNTDDLVDLTGGGDWDVELFYEIDADVHLMDVDQMSNSVDVDEVVSNVSPFIGNYIRTGGGDFYHQHYELMDAFERISQLFQEEDRYEAYMEFYEDTLERIQNELPDEDDRPSVAVLPIGADTVSGDMSGFFIDDGEGRKHLRDLGVSDALTAMEPVFHGSNLAADFDYEGLLEVDPDAIVVQFGIYDEPDEFQEQFVDPMTDDPVGQQVAAVAEDRVYRGGSDYQGPIMHLFNLEATAMQLYPDEFGEFPGWGNVSGDQQLFDRNELTDIIHGTV